MGQTLSGRLGESTHRLDRSGNRRLGSVERRRRGSPARSWQSVVLGVGGTAILDTALVRPDVSLLVKEENPSPSRWGSLSPRRMRGKSMALFRSGLSLEVSCSHGPAAKRIALWCACIARLHRWRLAREGHVRIHAGVIRVRYSHRSKIALEDCSPHPWHRKRYARRMAALLRLGDRFDSRVVLLAHKDSQFAQDSETITTPEIRNGDICIALHYESSVPVDRYPETPQPTTRAGKVESVELGPGLSGVRLPLPPTLCQRDWRGVRTGDLYFALSRGRSTRPATTNGDGIEHRLRLLVDGLPAPYGIHAEPDYRGRQCQIRSASSAKRFYAKAANRGPRFRLGIQSGLSRLGHGFAAKRTRRILPRHPLPTRQTLAGCRPLSRRRPAFDAAHADSRRSTSLGAVADLRRPSLPDGAGARSHRRAVRHRQPGQLQTVQRAEPRPARRYFGFINCPRSGQAGAADARRLPSTSRIRGRAASTVSASCTRRRNCARNSAATPSARSKATSSAANTTRAD